VLVDCQFLVSEAEGLIKMVASLDKPLEALFITHPHPDHFNGAGLIARAFPGVRIISTATTAEGIERSDAPKREFWTPVYKSNYPTFTQFPKERIKSGDSVKAAGIEFVLEDFGAGECENLSTIHLPHEQILFSSDLIYNRVHPWLAEGRSIAWLAQIPVALAKYKRSQRVYPGHGDETTLAAFNQMSIYINRFQELIRLNEADEAVGARMKEEFPSLPLEAMLGYNIPAVRKELIEGD
jgi:glyoxylase-like metal-dependent hydrolase (beta-lactamase superfamily II)